VKKLTLKILSVLFMLDHADMAGFTGLKRQESLGWK
jgi:hypothetical protein